MTDQSPMVVELGSVGSDVEFGVSDGPPATGGAGVVEFNVVEGVDAAGGGSGVGPGGALGGPSPS